MTRLALSLLGPFQARVGDRAVVHFATDKARALLAYLAVEGDRPHRRDTLAALLWPEWDDAGARSNLRLALHRLRQTIDAADPQLAEALFLTDRETVQVNLSAVEADVLRFLALLEICELHPHRLLHLCPSCLNQLAEAVTLYGGELLAGLSIADAPEFEQWELARREELERRLMTLLYRLADAHDQLGDYARALTFAHRQLEYDAYREETHRQVMRLYARQGERATALAHYERARQLLAGELGVEPDAMTVQLAEEIAAGQLTGAGLIGRPLLHHFPTHFTPFFGRDAEIAALADLCHAPSAHRLTTIIAPGGMGKTRLAIAAAEAVAEQPGFPDGITFLSLARTASADLLPSALAAALGLNLGGAGDPADQLAAFLGPKTALLVLDNMEHLLDGVDLLVGLLEQAPGLKLLVTSREALNVRGEERFMLGSLDEAALAQLFISAAARVRPGYAPDAAERAAIADIGRAVGGMPLAMELAATWVRLMDPPAIAAQIRRDLDFLTTTMRDLPPRQRSMRVVFDQMWAQLGVELPAAAEVLAMLSVLRGPFRLDAAEAISQASPFVLAQLIDGALLRAVGSGCFEVHELLRQYAFQRLAAMPEQATAAAERHATHYLALLARHGAVLGGPESKAALASLQRNIDNVRAAWAWAVENGRLEAIDAAMRPLETFYRFSGLLAEGIETLASAAAALAVRLERDGLDPALVYAVIYGLWRREALLLELMGRSDAALERLARARDGWLARDDRRQLARTINEMGYVSVRNNRLPEGQALSSAALALARDVGDEALIAACLHNLGNAAAQMGDLEQGAALLRESIARYRLAGGGRWLNGAIRDLSLTYIFRQEFDAARDLCEQSLVEAQAVGDRLGVLNSLACLGAVALNSGDLALAEHYTRRAYADSGELADAQMVSVCLGNLGHLALLSARRAEALHLYRQTIATSLGMYDYMTVEALLGLTVLAGERPEAVTWLAAGVAWRNSTGIVVEEGYIRQLREETEARLRAALGEQFDGLWARGLATSLATAAAEVATWAELEGYRL